MKTLVIVPAYNEEENILQLAKRLDEFSYDYLIINDCSTDKTPQLLDELNLNHIDLCNNMGLAGVTQTGFKYANDYGYKAAIVIDGDGQHNPEYIEELIKNIEKGFDYVVGSRFLVKKQPWSLRMMGSRIIKACIYIKTGTKVTDPTSGMRAVGNNLISDFANNMNFVAEPDALAYALHRKFKVCEVQVEMNEREGGTSFFNNPLNSIKFMINLCISILFIQW
ncbi:MAG: glycosyltransferase family 2 protein [Bacilli bacterium]|uniref:glycosyltransferase family 2 protein n=1 Tax=Anaerorhabdus sp. TaxID=1872524 RepID=UPI002FCC3F24